MRSGYVEDVTWLDGATLLAIDNDGHVKRIAGTPARAAGRRLGRVVEMTTALSKG